MYFNAHSYYSLRYGTTDIEQLLDNAVKNEVKVLALTDINTSMGIPEFVKGAIRRGIRPIAGIEFKNKDNTVFIGIAKNNNGFKELNDYLSWHNLNKKEFEHENLTFNNVIVIYPFGKKNPCDLRDYEYTGIKHFQQNSLYNSIYKSYLDKLLIWHPVTFREPGEWITHKCLRAIDHNTLFSRISDNQCARQDEIMVSENKLRKVFGNYPEIAANTEKVLEQCSIDIDFTTIKNKKVFTQSKYDDKLLLARLAFDGMVYRYGNNNSTALARINHELEIIDKLGFSSYFLIAWDIVRYSLSKGFFHVGRGSGANSIVAYCLGITDVDPINLNLYFERFLNPKRQGLPDFDIDFSWKDRDKVLEYIFKKYGRENTALLGATSTFQGRSIFRELGKVYGLPKNQIDLLVSEPGNKLNQNEIIHAISIIGNKIAGFPNMRTIHAGGVLISEEPITSYTALDLPPKSFPTTHCDMYMAEEIGFEKLDILSQRGISHIKDAVEIIYENTGDNVDIHNVSSFFEDRKVKAQLKSGETNGCFYIESPAMRGLLKKLKCDNYIGLVAASSIIRPGVAKSGMMKEYIKRFHNSTNINYIHPIMKEQLSETYGVMVFQEDVIKIAHHFAGFDLAEADVLRRAMSGKYRSLDEFKTIEKRYFSNCREKDYPEKITKEVWRQMESFAGYSFSKAHSASYAVESFQSLFLKSHYPLEFQVAVLNNFGGFYKDEPWVYLNEAKRQGGIIELPCLNKSLYLTRIIGKKIFMGFVYVKYIERSLIDTIISERNQNGPFLSLSDFMKRVSIKKEQLILLIRIGAFRFTGEAKSALLWKAHKFLNKSIKKANVIPLFHSEPNTFRLPEFEYSVLEDAYDEIELFGFPVSVDYFDMLQTNFKGEIQAKELLENVGKRVKMVGRLVTLKYAKTVRNEVMNFGAFVDSEGEFFDTVHFPISLVKYPFSGHGIYLILGIIVEEFGFPSIEVEKMARLPLKPNTRE